MAKRESHFSISVLLAIAYCAFGASLGAHAELIALAGLLVVICGMLPNVDEGSGLTTDDFSGLLSAIIPFVIIEHFPSVKAGGIVRVALVMLLGFMATKIAVTRFLQANFTHRGATHSIPMAIIVFEATYLLFSDLHSKERLFVAVAAFTGFISHLLIDAYGNVDLMGRAMGKNERHPPVLKLTATTPGKTFIMYLTLLVLTYFVLLDIYPNLRIVAGVKY